MAEPVRKLIIKGAREHNLKGIDLELPRDRLIVISGVSGSGKSSLAFDTIFAEGQRRYVESLSAYARQFLGRLDKPDVDYIEGLSPAISIQQKTTGRNPRSTVGTVTEIADYLRLLFARIGHAHCYVCGAQIREQSVDQIVDAIASRPPGSRLMLLAPVVRDRKGLHRKVFEDARRAGFVRVRVDGEVHSVDEPPALDKNKRHTLEVVVDRIVIKEGVKRRVADSVEAALQVSGGVVVAVGSGKDAAEERFSQSNACAECGTSFPELQPRLFSFNNPYGACPECSGLGVIMEFEPRLLMPDQSKSFNQGGIAPYNPGAGWHRYMFAALAKELKFSLDTPLAALPEKTRQAILHGSEQTLRVKYENDRTDASYQFSTRFKGVITDLRRRYRQTTSDGVKQWLESFMREQECTACHGQRLCPAALAVNVAERNIHDLTSLSIRDALGFFAELQLSETDAAIARQILKEIRDRLEFMASVGLEYLTLDRRAGTLSGGEAQRIRLATQIGSSLVGVLYILDEPTIGLHQRDNERLLGTLLRLRDLGNTLVVVEHDEQTLRQADYLVDLGPGAGVHGGWISAAGTVAEVMANTESPTGRYLAGLDTIPDRERRRAAEDRWITIRGAREHNLQGFDVAFPVGLFSVITGVSGSGKSTLLTDLLYPILANRLNRASLQEGAYDGVSGVEHLDKVINIDQSPIGRTPRSNPATYVGLFTPIRELFAGLPDSRARGYKPGRFSFNVKGGRCDNCQGDGQIKIEMHFLPDVYIVCDVCEGRRYNRETLGVRYKGKNIDEVLEMTVEEGHEFFRNVPSIQRKLATLLQVGLGYVKLGQSALTLSGGEAQRVKLSLELSKRGTGRTAYLLDEPTTGLHFRDVRQLLEVLQALADQGNTLILIEHNLDIIKQADYLIDLGPEGGDKGGTVIVCGPPEAVAASKESHTGAFLKHLLPAAAVAG